MALPFFTLFLLVFPWLGAGSFVKAVAIQFLLFSLFGMGWNTIGGYGGQVELGKAQYVGIGAYTVALTMVWWKIPFWVSMPIGVLIAIGYSFMIGYPLFQVEGPLLCHCHHLHFIGASGHFYQLEAGRSCQGDRTSHS